MKILIFYTSVGLGHKIIAENIGYHLSHAGHEVVLEDILEVQSGPLVEYATEWHQFINKQLPQLWKWMYGSDLVTSLGNLFRLKIAKKNSARALSLIEKTNPDLIITTQTTASAVVSYLRSSGQYKNKFAIAFSDYHFHPLWYYPNADFYLANIVEQRDELIKLGFDSKKIFICGMTLKPLEVVNKNEVKKKLRIPQNNKVVLFASGSLGTLISPNFFGDVIIELNKNHKDITSVIVSGKNEEFKNALESLNLPNTIVLPFYKPMSELYQTADLFVSKPGGLTTAESLQAKLPMIVTHWLPGQEDLNVEYLKKNNLLSFLTFYPARKEDLVSRILDLLNNEAMKQSFQDNPNRRKIVSDTLAESPINKAISSVFHNV